MSDQAEMSQGEAPGCRRQLGGFCAGGHRRVSAPGGALALAFASLRWHLKEPLHPSCLLGLCLLRGRCLQLSTELLHAVSRMRLPLNMSHPGCGAPFCAAAAASAAAVSVPPACTSSVPPQVLTTAKSNIAGSVIHTTSSSMSDAVVEGVSGAIGGA